MNGAIATAEPIRVALPQRPRFHGHLHTWTAAIAIPASIFLILAARPAATRVGASIYAASVLALFGTSAAYHRLTHTCDLARSCAASITR